MLNCISTSAKWSDTLTSLSLYKVTLKLATKRLFSIFFGNLAGL